MEKVILLCTIKTQNKQDGSQEPNFFEKNLTYKKKQHKRGCEHVVILLSLYDGNRVSQLIF